MTVETPGTILHFNKNIGQNSLRYFKRDELMTKYYYYYYYYIKIHNSSGVCLQSGDHSPRKVKWHLALIEGVKTQQL